MNLSNQFYHVSRSCILSGQILLSMDYSGLMVEKETKHFCNTEINKVVEKYFPDGISNHGNHYLSEKIRYWHDYESNDRFLPCTLTIEMVFELVRRSGYPHLPSRFQSLFAFETLQEAQKFQTEYSKSESKIYLIEADNYSKHDMSLLTIGFNSIIGITLGEKYWNGGQSEHPVWEVLLKLPVTIINEVV
jgi:hypothetical protein